MPQLWKKQSASLASFPHEILERILSHLPLSDIARAALSFTQRFGAMEHPELLLDLTVRTTSFNNRFKEAMRVRPRARLLLVTITLSSGLCFPTVQAALRAARAGDVIAVRPSSYDELLTVDKTVEIVGDGAKDRVTIKSFAFADADPRTTHPICISCLADGVRFANLSLAAHGRARIFLRGKEIRIEGCDIKCPLAVAPESDITIRRSTIHGGEPAGVLLIGGGTRLLMEACIIQNNYVGVMAGCGPARPTDEPLNVTLLKNKIHSNSRAGVQLAGIKTRGLISGNEVCDNLRDGLHLSQCTVVLRGNLVRFNVRDGIRRKRSVKVEEHDNKVFNNNLGDEPSIFSRFLTLDWLDPTSWGAFRALVVVLLLLLMLLKVLWRVFLVTPVAYLTGTTQHR